MSQKRILLVDDEIALLLMLKRILELAGHEVATVESGEAAIEHLAGNTVDVVLTDIAMPGMSGLDLIGHLRGNAVPVSIIAMSGASRDHLTKALELGAYRAFSKPFDFGELIRAIESCPSAA